MMHSLISPKDVSTIVRGNALTNSDDLNWRDLQLRHYRFNGQDVEVPPIDHFTLVRYLGTPTRMERQVNGQYDQAVCSANDFSMISSSLPARWQWESDIHVAHIYLSQQLMSRVASEVFGHPVDSVRLHDPLNVHDPALVQITDAVASEMANPLTGSALYIDTLSIQLAIHLLRNYADVSTAIIDSKSTAKGALSRIQQQRIEEYIDAHLHLRIRVDDLANILAMGSWSLSRKFRETFSLSPHEYVTQRRLERAAQLLHRQDLSISDIAYRCGFADQPHLTRTMRECMGVTPAQYRSNGVWR